MTIMYTHNSSPWEPHPTPRSPWEPFGSPLELLGSPWEPMGTQSKHYAHILIHSFSKSSSSRGVHKAAVKKDNEAGKRARNEKTQHRQSLRIVCDT